MTSPADTQQRIIDAASELMHSRSYADVGVAAICEQAGVQKGSFYHFFPSKQDLTLAVLDGFSLRMKEALIDKAFADDIPPLARLDRLADLLYRFQAQLHQQTGRVLGCPFGNLATELATQDEPIRKKVDLIFAHLQTHIGQVLQASVETGALSDIDVDATAQAMLAYSEGVMMLAKTRNDPAILRDLLPAMAHIRIPAR
ncbi:MAG: TetR/AcrR family transcriptional regulator [Gammaproteobacteria bacterium]|nr:TetR/AcrR family transcriptional regulator [Gammaproteobacteria bacterium]